jgi:hypothetical protein
MNAKYHGWCPVCRERITPGEAILPARGQEGWEHSICPATQAAPTGRPKKLHVARTGFTGGRRAGHTRGIRKIG